ncbi:hypothetical protein H6G41_26120 [Tolypothrix sp. FACHB-123]|uniref:hypothetical protein n=1 Tax=Tolypothrix sp. FACHB-123 TaxID=2692868 RepID=UPI0016825451|nr:hypothetical protein [Tolypothrix sp. FACHB-123]MBD2358046.1 hypothetical protein [Tolypothrix sp. FACHB-123]
MEPQIRINSSQGIWQRWQQAQSLVNDSVKSLGNSVQQAGQSVQETANQATTRVVDTMTATWEQAKGSVEQSWQTAEQIKSTTSVAFQNAIASSMNDWLVQHPSFFRLVQILSWAANHPIISSVLLVFILALLWSLVKAAMRLIEVTSWTILRVPIQLLQALVKVCFLSVSKFARYSFQTITGASKQKTDSALTQANSAIEYQNKQQRLADICDRLQAIHKEQQELLQEAARLMDSELNG